jgi:hypothetical protein
MRFTWFSRIGWVDFDWMKRPCPCDAAYAEQFGLGDEEVTADQEAS